MRINNSKYFLSKLNTKRTSSYRKLEVLFLWGGVRCISHDIVQTIAKDTSFDNKTAFVISSITWKGYEFLNNIRDDKVLDSND